MSKKEQSLNQLESELEQHYKKFIECLYLERQYIFDNKTTDLNIISYKKSILVKEINFLIKTDLFETIQSKDHWKNLIQKAFLLQKENKELLLERIKDIKSQLWELKKTSTITKNYLSQRTGSSTNFVDLKS